MLKGVGEFEMAIGLIIFTVGILLSAGIIYLKFTTVSAVVATSNDQIDMINFAHRARSCFSDSNGVIQTGRLVAGGGSGCGIAGKVCIRDMVTNELFIDCNYMGNLDDIKTKLYVTLQSGSDIHLGELSVKKT